MAEYGNLGLIYGKRGESDRAEEMLRKALEIQKKLGLQEYLANQYANLGSLIKDRGDLERARKLWTKARDIYAQIGIPHLVTKLQDWLDGLPKSVAKAKRVTGGGGKSNRKAAKKKGKKS